MATTKTAAQQMLDRIAAGEIFFHKMGAEWTVAGPAARIRTGATVTVTKAAGTTRAAIITKVIASGEKQGVSYAFATFRTAAARRPAVDAPRTVTSDAFGRGVQYGDGATVYTGVNGGRTQIWDD